MTAGTHTLKHCLALDILGDPWRALQFAHCKHTDGFPHSDPPRDIPACKHNQSAACSSQSASDAIDHSKTYIHAGTQLSSYMKHLSTLGHANLLESAAADEVGCQGRDDCCAADGDCGSLVGKETPKHNNEVQAPSGIQKRYTRAAACTTTNRPWSHAVLSNHDSSCIVTAFVVSLCDEPSRTRCLKVRARVAAFRN